MMDKNRRGEIALTLIRFYLKKKGIDLSAGRVRELGDISKRTGIPLKELNEFLKPLVQELVDDWL